jgi:hypothetical protein
MKSGGAEGRWRSDGTGYSMLGVKLVLAFHLCVVAHGSAILDAIMGVNVGIDMFANIIGRG